jgi:NitT/TauT family transport system substrate-binding protein
MIQIPSARPWLCAALFASACAAGCSRQPEAAKQAAGADSGSGKQLLKVGFQLDWYPSPEHGGHFQALVKNYYRDAGLDVAIAPGGPGSFPLPTVATGRMELAMGRCDDVILAVRQGLPLVIVCAQMQHDPQAIMMHEDGPVKSFQDLDGRSVMSGPGANWIAFVQKHYGVKFNIIPMDFGVGRFMTNRDFVQQCFITNEPYFTETHGVKTRALLIASGGYDPYRVIFTNRSFAERHPEAVRAFVAATIRGYSEYLHGDASEARARIQAENPSQSPALMDYSIDAMKRFRLVEGDPAKGERIGLITPQRMNELQQTLVDIKVLDAPMPLDRFVSFDFLPPEVARAVR